MFRIERSLLAYGLTLALAAPVSGQAPEPIAAGAASDQRPTTSADASARTPAAAPQPAERAPRAYGLTLGGSYAFRSRLPLRADGSDRRPWGLFVGTRIGWQVGGLVTRAPVTIGLETDFLYQTAPAARASYGLRYGLFIKHALSAQPKLRPFFCYGLGAAQIWIRGVDGRGIGHATRLGFGLDVQLRGLTRASVALSYEGIIMPTFASARAGPRDTSFHALLVSSGVWFGQ